MIKLLERAVAYRFRLLNFLGFLIGVIGCTGIKSYTHIIPKWLIVTTVIYAIFVACIFILGRLTKKDQ